MTNLTTYMAKGIMAAMLLTTGGMAFAAETDMPLMMTLNTNIYGYQGPTNYFTIYLGSTEENVEVYVESPTAQEYVTVNPWTLGKDEDGDNAALATAIALNVTETDSEVRIYGDKTKIDYIDVHGCYLNSLELEGEFPNLLVIDLSHNELTQIDLSEQANLGSIDLLDNAFTDASKMVIGTNHPGLQILQVGINDVCDPNLDLRNFPELQYFSARNNYGIYDVEPTACPNLIALVLEVTNVSSVDVSKNPLLDVLNLSQTRVTSVDLSNNPNLGELYISHEGSFNNSPQYKVHSIDLSNNPKLQYLDLGGNALTELDLSNNSDLRLLYLQRNQLSSIDVSNMEKLAVLNLSNNNFTFATLPIPENGWDYYYYRSPLPCDLKYKVGEPIDFSSSVIRAPYVDSEGNTIHPETYATVFAAPSGENEYEIDSSLYTWSNGVITFNEALPDSVYVSFYCDVFPDWTLSSASFKVKTPEEFDAPSAAFSFVPSQNILGKQISISMGATLLTSAVAYPSDVTIIDADGNKTVLEGVVSGASMPNNPNVGFTVPSTAGEVTVALPDGFAITALGMDGIELSSINLDPAEGLFTLQLTNCNLSEVNMPYNRALTSLDLSGNRLTSVDLAGIRGDYQKWELHTVNLSNNRLRQFSTVSDATIYNLDLSGNQFTSFDLKYYTGLRNFDISNNKLTGEIDFSKVEKIRTINVSGNSLSSILLNEADEALDDLTSMDLTGNNFTFATLPMLQYLGSGYQYAPQNKMTILSTAPAINLSAQNVVQNGVGTTYTWKYVENNNVVANDLLTDNSGAFLFDESLIGQALYCEMTNPAFPSFDNQPLTTTGVTIASIPDKLVASFVTANDGTAEIGFRFTSEGDNAVYIDWRGDGSEFEPYIYEANVSYPSIYRTGTTYAGATAKIYAYESPENISVFAMNNTPLESLDLSPLTQIEAIDVHNAGLTDGKLVMPASQNLWELVLDGNSFESQDFSQYTKVTSLNLAGNNYTTFDLSNYPGVRFAIFDNNKLTDIKFGNNKNLIQVNLANNNFKTIDLTGAEGLSELLLSNNYLSEIDLTPVKESLYTLMIAGNNFTLATLPRFSDMGGQFMTYDYSNQKPVEVECFDAKIDLSTQAMVGETPTEFYWFLGDFQNDVYYDYEMEMFIGEALEGPEDSDDPEYTITDGVTTFLYPQTRSVICAMTNSEYPALILYTAPTKVNMAGIQEIFGADENGLVDVYSLGGVRVKTRVVLSEALRGLSKGIYIINGRKVMIP